MVLRARRNPLAWILFQAALVMQDTAVRCKLQKSRHSTSIIVSQLLVRPNRMAQVFLPAALVMQDTEVQ